VRDDFGADEQDQADDSSDFHGTKGKIRHIIPIGILLGLGFSLVILSSSDILNKLGSDAIVRSCARMAIVDGKPRLDAGEYLYIYIDKYPTVDEFEATWKIWIVDGGHDNGDLAMEAISLLLPNFEDKGSYYTTTDFASERTVVKTETEKQLESLAAEREQAKQQFQALSEGVQTAVKGVRDGIDGKDGRDGVDGLPGPAGRDGRDGRDGKDIDATETDLEDLQNVEPGIAYEKGQVLTWDGSKWTNLFIPQLVSVTNGGGAGGGIEEAPQDGTPYARQDGGWTPLTTIPGNVPEAPEDGGAYVRQNSNWVPLTSVPVDISANTLDELSGINLLTLEAGEALIYDGSQWVTGGDLTGGSF